MRVERTESMEQRDERIVRLRGRGLSLRAVAEQVGMSANGVHAALARMDRQPGDDDDD